MSLHLSVKRISQSIFLGKKTFSFFFDRDTKQYFSFDHVEKLNYKLSMEFDVSDFIRIQNVLWQIQEHIDLQSLRINSLQVDITSSDWKDLQTHIPSKNHVARGGDLIFRNF